ncbi:MAG: hypothetical protein WCJ39_09390 [bacterium]
MFAKIEKKIKHIHNMPINKKFAFFRLYVLDVDDSCVIPNCFIEDIDNKGPCF